MIALLGVTGAGKSTFANTASGKSSMKISHGSQPCEQPAPDVSRRSAGLNTNETCIYLGTQDPQEVKFQLGGRTIVLIDTPGFDDDKKSDVRILEDIATWMAKKGYLKERMLDGLIFLHPVTHTRAGGSELNRTKLLEQILGRNAYNRVIIASTMWDDIVSEDTVTLRLQTRLDEGGVWHELKNNGASYVKHYNTQKSAHDIIRGIMDITDRLGGPPTTLFETELKEKKGRVGSTSAGKTLESRIRFEIEILQDHLVKHLGQRPPATYKSDGDREHKATWRRWKKDRRVLEAQLDEKEKELRQLQNIIVSTCSPMPPIATTEQGQSITIRSPNPRLLLALIGPLLTLQFEGSLLPHSGFHVQKSLNLVFPPRILTTTSSISTESLLKHGSRHFYCSVM